MAAAKSKDKNLFCARSALNNEASVEQFFVSRLIDHLGYDDKNIRPKTSLEKIKVSVGRKKYNYLPDYALIVARKPRWICDAKATSEDLDDWVGQGRSYTLELNKKYTGENPVEFFMLSNGLETRVYRWDDDAPVVVVAFDEFVKGNANFDLLVEILSPAAFTGKSGAGSANTITMVKKSPNDLNLDFAWCHNQIHKKGDLSYTAAFMEFVKLVFLKLLSDREVHRRHPKFSDPAMKSITVDAIDVKFSTVWIESAEALGTENPLDRIQFSELVQNLETEIKAGRKKRIFSQDERIHLPAGVIRDVAERLQGTDLYGIDADLNGRLFETFLSATLRGKALGQYFTPRSVVKLATAMGDLHVEADPSKCSVVLDACCGTGGFLIEALADMWAKADRIRSLSADGRKSLKESIATQCMLGIDSAKDPALARIARINMYLHGDGGSRVYQFDALDKKVAPRSDDNVEIKAEKREFEALLNQQPDGVVDVVLTNPPFAKEYERAKAGTVSSSEERVLDEYDLAFKRVGTKRIPKNKLRSSVMFLERYLDLLKPGGRLITIIDDSVLTGAGYDDTRAWLLENFVLEAVVSLPGDAFQRSQARVKTSILSLRKKVDPSEGQSDVFMYYCTRVGVDDAPRQRVLPIDEINRERAIQEIAEVSQLFKAFQTGDSAADDWTVAASALKERWDVKACLLEQGRNVATWKSAKVDVVEVRDLVKNRFDPPTHNDPDIIDGDDGGLVNFLRVRYDGFAEEGDEVFAGDVKYPVLYRVHTGDIVVSHINAVHGAVAVIPETLDGYVVSPEYSVLRASGKVDRRVIWALLRTPEARAELLLSSKGIGRTRIHWDQLADLQIPLPDTAGRAELVKLFNEVEKMERDAQKKRAEIKTKVETTNALNNQEALDILAAFKPPR